MHKRHSGRWRRGSSVIYFLTALIGFSPAFAPSQPSEQSPSLSETVSDDTGHWLLQQVRTRLSGRAETERPQPGPVPSHALSPMPVTLFITSYGRGQTSRPPPAKGAGDNLSAALSSAIEVLSTTLSSPEQNKGQISPHRIQIDILTDPPVPFPNLPEVTRRRSTGLVSSSRGVAAPAQPISNFFDVGMDGLVIEAGGRAHYLLPSEIIFESIAAENPVAQTTGDFLDRAFRHLGLSSGTKVSRFRTIAFIEDEKSSASLRLVRGTVQTPGLTAARLLSAARLAGDYLERMQRPDGSFRYWYNALENRFSSRSYNILRHAGTTVSLYDLYSATGETRYLTTANLAVRFLKSRFRPVKDRLYVLDNDGKAKLGANGLALLALVRQMNLNREDADRETAEKLANQILAMQKKDGSFESYYRLRGDEPAGSVSLYYPGEAILGLASLYRITGNKKYLSSARLGADYLIGFQQEMSRLPPDAWLAQALEVLVRIEQNKTYADHAISLAEAMIEDQYKTGSSPAGFEGGFGPGPPRSTPAAARSEGILAAYRLALLRADARTGRIADALRASARFQLSQQFDSQSSFFLPNPEMAAGGFRGSFTSLRVRIDFVQHNISSLLGVAKALY